MRRFLLILWIAVGLAAMTAAMGCHRTIKTHVERENVQESEPQMVSPGEPVVE